MVNAFVLALDCMSLYAVWLSVFVLVCVYIWKLAGTVPNGNWWLNLSKNTTFTHKKRWQINLLTFNCWYSSIIIVPMCALGLCNATLFICIIDFFIFFWNCISVCPKCCTGKGNIYVLHESFYLTDAISKRWKPALCLTLIMKFKRHGIMIIKTFHVIT